MNTYNKLTFKLAFRLAAPHSWAASIIPAIFGCVYCIYKHYRLSVFEMLALIIASILMQSSVNALNDYFDYIKGTDTKEDNLDRSDAVLVYEGVNPKSALFLGVAFLAVAGVLGLVLILTRNTLLPLWIGLIGAACVLLYSGGIKPISYLPIGEFVSGFVMGGLIPLGIVAVATGKLDFWVLLFASPLVISIGLILMSNNGCDIEKDIKAGRKTLPVLLGREKAQKVFSILVTIWDVLLWVLPILLVGFPGILCFLFLQLLVKKEMDWLKEPPLDQEHRIEQMTTILMANIKANGIYIISIVVGLIYYSIQIK